MPPQNVKKGRMNQPHFASEEGTSHLQGVTSLEPRGGGTLTRPKYSGGPGTWATERYPQHHKVARRYAQITNNYHEMAGLVAPTIGERLFELLKFKKVLKTGAVQVEEGATVCPWNLMLPSPKRS